MPQQFKGKKEQFMQRPKRHIIYLLVVAVVAAGLGVTWLATRQAGQPAVQYFGEPVAAPRSYVGRVISMTRVEPVLENGQIKISLGEIDKNNIVSFELENDQGTLVPLMAYITPSGRLFAGSSMCEPCRGRTYSLAGETLVCDTCRTTFTIEDHRFISGSAICGAFTPVYMHPVVSDGMVIIEQQQVLSWRVRAL